MYFGHNSENKGKPEKMLEKNKHFILLLYLFRLHDYYRFNLTEFVNEGSFVLDGVRHETSGDLTVWDAFKIGKQEISQFGMLSR